MVSGLYDGFLNVVFIDDPDVKMELLNAFQGTYEQAQFGATNGLLSATRRLNSYILNTTDYRTIDDFLQAEGIVVSQDWADLSEAAGAPINSSYIG
jgi:hypothetical protein